MNAWSKSKPTINTQRGHTTTYDTFAEHEHTNAYDDGGYVANIILMVVITIESTATVALTGWTPMATTRDTILAMAEMLVALRVR